MIPLVAIVSAVGSSVSADVQRDAPSGTIIRLETEKPLLGLDDESAIIIEVEITETLSLSTRPKSLYMLLRER